MHVLRNPVLVTVGALLLLSWLPVTGSQQFLIYAGVPAILVLAGLMRAITFSRALLPPLGIFFGAAILVAAIHPTAGVINPLLALLTYGSLFILAVRFKAVNAQDMNSVVDLIKWVTLFEGLLGIFQLVTGNGGISFNSGDAGDVVKGTTGGAMSHLYALKMTVQVTFLAYWHVLGRGYKVLFKLNNLTTLSILIGLAAAVSASYLIGMVFFGIGLFLTHLYFARANVKRLFKTYSGLAIIAVLGGLFLFTTQRSNVNLIQSTIAPFFGGEAQADTRYQKFITLGQSYNEVLLRDVPTAAVGLGLGRYSSRAAMILSGGYLYNANETIPVSLSDETDRYIYAVWNPLTWSRFGGSTMGMPTSSFQAVLIEHGIIGMILLGIILFRAKRVLSEAVRTLAGDQRIFAYATAMLVLPLIITMLLDVWAEFPSLMILPCLLFSLTHSLLRQVR